MSEKIRAYSHDLVRVQQGDQKEWLLTRFCVPKDDHLSIDSFTRHETRMSYLPVGPVVFFFSVTMISNCCFPIRKVASLLPLR